MRTIELFAYAVKNNASDLHVSTGSPPLIRIDGDIQRTNAPALTHKEVTHLLYGMMSPEQRTQFDNAHEIDFSYTHENVGRFRVNAFLQAQGASAVFRIIPPSIPTMHALGLPTVLQELAHVTQGLILFTGPAGSGKSTTLASVIHHMNTHRYAHVITIEDPIEFVHKSHHCLIQQREVYRDTVSFASALRAALRQDPNIILLGELRDLETIRLAITAAETGHLVLATLHTSSATQAINRIIDVFSEPEAAMIRTRIADSLQAVIAQTLLKKRGGGRIAAFEIMRATAAIRHLIRDNKPAQLYSTIQTNSAAGMCTMEQHKAELVARGLVLS